MGGPSGCGWRIESGNQLGKVFDHAGVVTIGMVVDEVDHLAIAIGCLSAVAARLVHHSQAVSSVVHIGEAAEQVACSRLGLVQPDSAY
jgi:hypothetical protein